MGTFDFLKTTLDPVIKNSPLDAVDTNSTSQKWRCMVCGKTLSASDYFCPNCGKTPVDKNRKSK